ncbi:MAG: DUF4159 domain-containing protein [Candidatus Kapabacteria bacterium]|nr:DUF4159 domain-containing protein [Candidatus Kapabacteria bacterium]
MKNHAISDNPNILNKLFYKIQGESKHNFFNGKSGIIAHSCLSSIIIIMLLIITESALSQQTTSAFKIARVKYSGGGDWYNDPSSEPNLLKYLAANTNIKVAPFYEYVELASDNLFLYPVIFITGHGNLNFSETEIKHLRAYLENGGFLYIDDDYGLDESVHKEMKKVFPEQKLVELPFNHEIYTCHFKFPNGLPKIHEHDNKTPQGFGLFAGGRLCVYYTYETNPSDGWADADAHNDPPEKRELSFKIGVNIMVYALSH